MDLNETLLNRLEMSLTALANAHQSLQQQYHQLEKAYLKLEQTNRELRQKNDLARERLATIVTTLKASLPDPIQIDEIPPIPETITEDDD